MAYVLNMTVKKRIKCLYRLNNSTLNASGNKIVTEMLQYVFHASNRNKSHMQTFRLSYGDTNRKLATFRISCTYSERASNNLITFYFSPKPTFRVFGQ
jgi:hypothetical protein